jgi:rSAM/selenodomain-associated transferase 2
VDEPLRLSVIIPVLNEEKAIESCLQRLQTYAPHAQIIVVDGASGDRTVELARQFGDVQVLEAPRGRAPQMNAGAEIATGDVLLFLHADVELPPSAPRLIASALKRPGVVGGAFRTWTVSEGRSPLKFLLHLADLRSRYSRSPYGDQAIFVRREIFQRLHGFPAQPLMEDLAFSQRLHGLGRVEILPASVRVCGRRFLARPIRYFLLTNIFPLLYRFGVSPHRMARWYGNPR